MTDLPGDLESANAGDGGSVASPRTLGNAKARETILDWLVPSPAAAARQVGIRDEQIPIMRVGDDRGQSTLPLSHEVPVLTEEELAKLSGQHHVWLLDAGEFE